MLRPCEVQLEGVAPAVDEKKTAPATPLLHLWTKKEACGEKQHAPSKSIRRTQDSSLRAERRSA